MLRGEWLVGVHSASSTSAPIPRHIVYLATYLVVLLGNAWIAGVIQHIRRPILGWNRWSRSVPAQNHYEM